MGAGDGVADVDLRVVGVETADAHEEDLALEVELRLRINEARHHVELLGET